MSNINPEALNALMNLLTTAVDATAAPDPAAQSAEIADAIETRNASIKADAKPLYESLAQAYDEFDANFSIQIARGMMYSASNDYCWARSSVDKTHRQHAYLIATGSQSSDSLEGEVNPLAAVEARLRDQRMREELFEVQFYAAELLFQRYYHMLIADPSITHEIKIPDVSIGDKAFAKFEARQASRASKTQNGAYDATLAAAQLERQTMRVS